MKGKFKYTIRGYSSKSHKKKREKVKELPKLNKLVEVYPKYLKGNENLEIRRGIFILETKHLLFLETEDKSNKLEAFSKSDLKNQIYIYEYL
ncbi:hypothetical protein [Sporosalibacterium faouarense]|uniref:hypothetical protein n=1 Tax=Sporosalibacterium faouarense TaxID=516123 RepID=UPI00141C0A94|nr:hypothetical protein [Sporosalibacterium faouarense]MTI48725.1 hypothetical protein [Bacillota bacterium]